MEDRNRMKGTERIQREKASARSEAELKYRAVFEQSPDGILIIDAEGKILDFNKAAHTDLGYTREEFEKLSISDIYPLECAAEIRARIQDKPEFASRVPAWLAQIREQGQAVFESAHIKKDGSRMPVEVNSRILDCKGTKVYFSVVRDITERRQAEEELQRREKQLAKSQRIAHIGSWEHNLTTGQVFWSDELFHLLGLDPKTDQGDFRMFFDMIHPDDRPALKKAIDETVRTGRHFSIDYRFRLRDGRPRILHAQAELRHDETGTEAILSGTCQDITEWKESESALKESEKRLCTLIDAIPDSVIFKDAAGRHVIVNKANEELFGLSPAMFIGKMVEDLLPPDLAAICRRNDEDVLKNKKAVRDEEQSTDKNGNKQILDTIRVPLYDDNGNAIGLVGIIRDVTERKQAEEKIRKNEQFIRNILDTVDEGFIVVDRDFRILTANKAYCGQIGESDGFIIGRHCYEISHKTLRPCHEEGEECAVRHVFETGEPHTALHKHPDAKGSILYVETKAFPIKDSKGAVTSVIETVNNITEKHLLEEEQLKTQKLEAIGTLAGGIAHDFNNLLQGVFGYISMAKVTLGQKERALAMLEQAEKALHMSVDLTAQLLTFSKGGKPVKKKIQLQSVIENSVKFALSGSSVDYRIRFDEELWAVDADEGQIGQVIQNIVLNADQAMPAGGMIVIAARNVSAPVKGLSTPLVEGKYVEISVKDSGIGIPKQYVPRLFDPYFTTKEKGSGLGLATSYSIIKNHSGLIDVKSQSGKGSTFFVYLPAIKADEERFTAIPAIDEGARKGRVLVMDDEELVRNIVGIMLKALGHEADVAENGEEATAKYREALLAGRRFDVVILDVTIRGGMGGEETLRKLLALDPEVKAVVSSGYAESATISEYASLGFSACLTKPYEVNALRNVLNLLLK
jgi:PAS domain S-box-containing protein